MNYQSQSQLIDNFIFNYIFINKKYRKRSTHTFVEEFYIAIGT